MNFFYFAFGGLHEAQAPKAISAAEKTSSPKKINVEYNELTRIFIDSLLATRHA